jgi:hypothetical protein
VGSNGAETAARVGDNSEGTEEMGLNEESRPTVNRARKRDQRVIRVERRGDFA